jgi:mono/diheme cytochrome c family protein
MWNQARVKPLSSSTFFADGQGSRLPVPNTVARGQLRLDEHLYTGRVNKKLVNTFPFPITKEVLERGRDRFNIFCAPCHGKLGDGNGMIAQRGQWPKKPANYHIDRLRKQPAGYFFEVITNGIGLMYSYASRIPVEDRWAIVAYVQALQFSRHAPVGELEQQDIAALRDSHSSSSEKRGH